MKKILLLLFALCLTFGVYAQTKKISRVEVYYNDDTTPQRIHEFRYDEYGRMLGSDWSGRENGSVSVTYNDIANTVKIESSEEMSDLKWTFGYVENGRIIRLDTQYWDEDMYTSSLNYNNNGELVSFTQGMGNDTYTSKLEWCDGNILSVAYAGEGKYEFSLSDYDSPASLPFFMEGIDGVADFDLPNPFYYLPGYMGKRSKKLLSGYTAQIGDTRLQGTYSYKFDADGNVSEFVSDEVEDEDGFTMSWRERIVCSYMVVSGINDVAVDGHGSREAIYNAAGQQRPDMGRGLNIVRSADGTVRKVIVK